MRLTGNRPSGRLIWEKFPSAFRPRAREISPKLTSPQVNFLLIAYPPKTSNFRDISQKPVSAGITERAPASQSMLCFSPEPVSRKQNEYAIQDCLDEGDLEALRDRFERSQNLGKMISFSEKLDPVCFARAMKDISSTVYTMKSNFLLLLSSSEGI